MASANFLPSDFDTLVSQALTQYQVPGVAIGMVKDDAPIFARGYGVKQIGASEPIDPKTVFGIGSTTKAFTAAVVAALVGDGKLDWDTPVINYAPSFRLRDPWVTREATLRDLLCHRLGLPRGVMMRLRSGCDLATYLARMSNVPPVHSFRSRYIYTNTSFDWAGEIAAAAVGTSWSQLVRERIFAPLGMSASSTNVNALAQVTNLVTPHAQRHGVTVPIPRRNIGDDPAGSINSNLVDMLQWVRLQLGHGVYQGARVLAAETLREMHASQMAIPHPEETELGMLMPLDLDISFWTYGLGWFVHCYRGKKLVWHGGQIDGHSSIVALLPQENFGLVILVNIHDSLLHGALMFTLLDAYLGFKRDWLGDCFKLSTQWGVEMDKEQNRIVQARVRETVPSVPLKQYAGNFTSAWCGDAQIIAADAGLLLRYGGRVCATLDHWHYDTFRLTWHDAQFAPELVVFSLDARGQVERLRIPSLCEFCRASG